MIYWFRHLPQVSMDYSEWTPFIRNPWFRQHYMKFVYVLMGVIYMIPRMAGGRPFSGANSDEIATHIRNTQAADAVSVLSLVLIIAAVFITHEMLHILVIHKEDISLTFSGIFFWLNTNAVLSKRRFWLFMTLPILMLSVVPGAAAFFLTGYMKSLLLFICWVNLILSGSDLVNSTLILLKPKGAVFCRGYYRLK